MGGEMDGAQEARHLYRVLLDAESHELIAVKWQDADNFEVLGPVVQHVRIVDRDGNEACVTAEKRLHVVDSSGLPHLFPTDAAGANAYTFIGSAPHHCTRMLFHLETKDAILSFDGVTEHLWLGSARDQMLLDGLDIAAGTPIYVKNQTAGQNYANLSIAVW